MFQSSKSNYGSVNFLMGKYNIYITTFREDLNYVNRKPSTVNYITNLEQDLTRRDFTINAICMNKDGKIIENYELFIEKTNVNFVNIIDENNIEVQTWERGAGATLACGTGCCASVVALNKLGMCLDKVKVKTLGGNLEVQLNSGDVYMIGEAGFICRGELL